MVLQGATHPRKGLARIFTEQTDRRQRPSVPRTFPLPRRNICKRVKWSDSRLCLKTKHQKCSLTGRLKATLKSPSERTNRGPRHIKTSNFIWPPFPPFCGNKNIRTKISLGREGLSNLITQVTSYHRGKPRQELKAKLWRQKLNRDRRGSLFFMACPFLGLALLKVGWALPSQSIKKMAPETCLQANVMEAFSTGFRLLPWFQLVSTWQKKRTNKPSL